MRERISYDYPKDYTEKNKKSFNEFIKNEFKLFKKISIINEDGEEIAKTLKCDYYYDYIEFWLDECLPDNSTNGIIKELIILDEVDKKGNNIKKLKAIVI